MKKYALISGVAVILILCVKIFYAHNTIDLEGKILLNMNNDGNKEIIVYDCRTKEFQNTGINEFQAVLSKNNTLLINEYNAISEYDLNTKEKTTVYQGETFDFFAICNDKLLSLSNDNCIFLYNIETQEKKIIVQDNGSTVYSWSDNGEVLYYSDKNNKIKSVNILSGKIKENGIGRDPVICGYDMAYRNGDKLIVKNLQTNTEYEYNGKVYSYCFSPTGREVLIEDELSIWTAIKNIFRNGIVLGHSVVVWDFENNKRNTIIDACTSVPNLICGWEHSER